MAPRASGRGPAVRGLLTGVVVAAALACACNALLGTPAPELADASTFDAASHEAGVSLDATTDAGAESAADVTTAKDADASSPPWLALPPSCVTDGGSDADICGTNGVSCCASTGVVEDADSGTYYRAFTVDGGAPVGESAQATVSPFSLDVFEVTVGRFRRFVDATRDTGWMPDAGAGIHTHLGKGQGLVEILDGGAIVYEQGWQSAWNANVSQGVDWDVNLLSCSPSTWTQYPGDNEHLPINCINWFEAYAFCIWDGGFLPSEAEWEYAAANGNQQRQYPWGSTDPGTTYLYGVYGCEYPGGGLVDAAGTCGSVANIAPVGTAHLGMGAWGQLDLGGNVHEQVLDFYHPEYPSPCTDCADLVASGNHISRGGSWLVQASAMQTFERFWYPLQDRDAKAGVRCARSP